MKKISISIIILLLSFTSFSYKELRGGNSGQNGGSGSNALASRSAGCNAGNSSIFLQYNNVKAIVETGGILWTDRQNSAAGYEIPKTVNFDGAKIIYSGALWMGGTDVNGQLRLAAQKFANAGVDFWPGPLSTFGGPPSSYDPSVPQGPEVEVVRAYGDAEIIPSECEKYDKFFSIEKSIVARYDLIWRCANGFATDEECEVVDDEGFALTSLEMGKILEWPAHGDIDLGQDYYLAPFYDNPNGPEGLNGRYDPEIDGDYPWYDLENDIACGQDRRVTLFGDETQWWVFNDKGNVHTESNGEPIGMEIRAQAFSFATNDEINDMTFYNYELINRGTQTLFETYFAQYVDSDLGGAGDDYVGCDVGRGLGFSYNGDANDNSASSGEETFGQNPPAVGIDFFEGPYQDIDGIANPLTESTPVGSNLAYQLDGVPYEGLGLGYDDDIVDNERMGMRRFFYYNNAGGVQGDPNSAAQFYGFMQGMWGTSGTSQSYGGNGLTGTTPTNYMFPGDSDPAGWGTTAAGEGPSVSAGGNWSEVTENNTPADRRFAQVAGPFTLKPGAVNNLTVGVVYGRSYDGDLLASVRSMKSADTKAQSLFDACFIIIEPPLAPILTIQEMENELILLINGNSKFTEGYEVEDNINIPDSTSDGVLSDKMYRFQGYQIFQLKDAGSSVADLEDVTQARLVGQCDINDGVSKLINYEFDEADGIEIPAVKVNGNDEGLIHSFKITEDLFATGDRTIVNHRKYYYIAVAYAHNSYETYNPLVGPFGQKKPYLVSRQSAARGEIETVVGIPHDPGVEADGTTFGTYYGWTPKILQIEGIGNGGKFINLTQESISEILSKGEVEYPEYENGAGPIEVKVIDPLNVKAGKYTLTFEKGINQKRGSILDTASWTLTKELDGVIESVTSKYAIGIHNEQLIPEWGISVDINQIEYGGGVSSSSLTTTPIGAEISFKDSSKIWLTGLADSDLNYPTNWIRAGTGIAPSTADESCAPELWISNPCYYYDRTPIADPDATWESLLGGSITASRYVGYEVYGMPFGKPGDNPTTTTNEGYFKGLGNTFFNSTLKSVNIHDVDVVFTPDTKLWTKCVVLEINDNEDQTVGGSDVLEIRNQTSVDKTGKAVSDENDKGMGWFPGYAINVNTGQRLNMAFAENSWLAGENGNDMIWNPTSNLMGATGDPLFGGMHYIYVFNAIENMPIYDESEFIFEELSKKDKDGHKDVFEACTWVLAPMLVPNREVLETEVTIQARVNMPYAERTENKTGNLGRPKYEFTITDADRVTTAVTAELGNKLDIINIVPNPYYAYSEYEENRIDNRVKITNLPEKCNVKIFNMQGALIRQYTKDDPLTSLDWDLENTAGVPIASGLYIIHVEVPGVGSKILKWYGSMRQIDLENI